MYEGLMIRKGLLIDFGRTLYDKEKKDLFPGVIEFLKYCKRIGYIKLGMITNNGPRRKELIDDLNLHEYFDRIIVAEEKSAEDFRKCISGFGLDPENVTVVDDRLDEGIKFGNMAGANTVWLRNGKYADRKPKNNDEKPKYTIRSLSSILDIPEFKNSSYF